MRIIWILVLVFEIAATPVLAKNHKENDLPPGLRKKSENGQALPPGWQKKLAKGKYLDHDVYKRCVKVYSSDDHGIITVHVDGRVIRLIEATREIVEILK